MSKINIEKYVKGSEWCFQEVFISYAKPDEATKDQKKQYFQKKQDQIMKKFVAEYLEKDFNKLGSIEKMDQFDKMNDFGDWLLNSPYSIHEQKKTREDLMKLLGQLIKFPQKRKQIEQKIKNDFQI